MGLITPLAWALAGPPAAPEICDDGQEDSILLKVGDRVYRGGDFRIVFPCRTPQPENAPLAPESRARQFLAAQSPQGQVLDAVFDVPLPIFSMSLSPGGFQTRHKLNFSKSLQPRYLAERDPAGRVLSVKPLDFPNDAAIERRVREIRRHFAAAQRELAHKPNNETLGAVEEPNVKSYGNYRFYEGASHDEAGTAQHYFYRAKPDQPFELFFSLQEDQGTGGKRTQRYYFMGGRLIRWLNADQRAESPATEKFYAEEESRLRLANPSVTCAH